jgi:hypothetical protein
MIIVNKKKLPMIDPPISVFMAYGYHLSITLQYEEALPWFYSNYIELYGILSTFDNGQSQVFFQSGGVDCNPYLENYPRVPFEQLGKDVSIIDFIKSKIGEGYYFNTGVDEYYIPNLRLGNHLHYGHQILVFGFNNDDSTLDIVGYKKDGQYGETTCTFEDFTKAYLVKSEIIKLFKPNFEYTFTPDIENIKKQIVNYLNGFELDQLIDPWFPYDKKPDCMCGILIYDFLKLALNQSIVDPRGYHALLEHKSCMLLRLQFLRTQFKLNVMEILEEYRIIENETKILKHFALKYILLFEMKNKKDQEVISTMIVQLEKIKNLEISTLNKLLINCF